MELLVIALSAVRILETKSSALQPFTRSRQPALRQLARLMGKLVGRRVHHPLAQLKPQWLIESFTAQLPLSMMQLKLGTNHTKTQGIHGMLTCFCKVSTNNRGTVSLPVPDQAQLNTVTSKYT